MQITASTIPFDLGGIDSLKLCASVEWSNDAHEPAVSEICTIATIHDGLKLQLGISAPSHCKTL
jgi:hypothetical protein